MPEIEILSPPESSGVLAFRGTVLLGRDSASDIRLEDDTVSRRHAMVNLVGGSYFISDLGSGNGTWLNGARVAKPTLLDDGDRLRLILFVVGRQAHCVGLGD